MMKGDPTMRAVYRAEDLISRSEQSHVSKDQNERSPDTSELNEGSLRHPGKTLGVKLFS